MLRSVFLSCSVFKNKIQSFIHFISLCKLVQNSLECDVENVFFYEASIGKKVNSCIKCL